MEIDDYVGFFPKNYFWIDKAIDWNDADSDEIFRGIIPKLAVVKDDVHFKCAVTVDGLILLHIKKLAASTPNLGSANEFFEAVNWWEEYLDYAHTLLMLLESISIEQGKFIQVSTVELTSIDTCTVGLLGWWPRRYAYGRESNNLSARIDTINWIKEGRNAPPPFEVQQSSVLNYGLLGAETVSTVLTRFAVTCQSGNALKRLSFLVKSKSAYERGDFRVSFVLSWFVIESICRGLVVDFSKESTPKNGPKMHQIEQLLQDHGILSEGDRQNLKKLRDLRNQLMHRPDTTTCMPDDAFRAHGLALQLICRDLPFSVYTKLSYTQSH